MYTLPKSDKQLQMIIKKRSPQDYYRLCLLLVKFIRKNNYYDLLHSLLRNTNRGDIYIYNQLLPYMKEAKSNDTYMAGHYYRKLLYYIGDIHPKTYLDFGCGKCGITYEFGRLLNLKKADIYGTDIEAEFESSWDKERARLSNINFEYSRPKNIIPFDKKFDLVSCFMVLHHISKESIIDILKAIKEALNEGGILFIKEHNVISDTDRIFADIVHSLFMIQVNREVNKKKIFEQENIYRSYTDWVNLITNEGFIEISNAEFVYNESLVSVTRSFYAVFKKA